ncbi:hypothetical protein CLV24_12137 [Pontibacter ummariensis]|uniref:Uncharacterized protein n=1 Tax=Pontibacter ummariensis TaxID=1610492 RepID=A0A239JBL9_9BACT|nr:hypothetical protein CLV24_12137 [Pontibacter ummariensis]SNT03311.1 hypothetical protein SAMN06296052_12137 [Pontibacter ummariensis]
MVLRKISNNALKIKPVSEAVILHFRPVIKMGGCQTEGSRHKERGERYGSFSKKKV